MGGLIERIMRLRARLKLPKEHGAWAMLYVPLVAGVLVAGSFSWRVVLIALAMTFIFIARESVLAWWRAHRRGGDKQESLRVMLIYLALAGARSRRLFSSVACSGLRLWGWLQLLCWPSTQSKERGAKTEL